MYHMRRLILLVATLLLIVSSADAALTVIYPDDKTWVSRSDHLNG